MTLVSRNKFFLSLFIFSIITTVALTGFVIMAVMQQHFVIPQDPQALFQLPQVPLFTLSFYAAIIAATLLVLYSTVILGIALVNFEKTRSLEILFFSIFAFGCIFEGVRILLPVFDLWSNNSTLYIMTGRLLIFGRALSVVSLVSLSLLSLELENKQNVEMNLFIVLAIATLFARLMPINTLVIPSNCSIRFGYEKMFLIIATITLIVGTISMLYQGYDRGSSEYTKVGTGFFLLGLGYLILTETDCFFSLIAGTALLITGSILFLLNLHRFHIWK